MAKLMNSDRPFIWMDTKGVGCTMAFIDGAASNSVITWSDAQVVAAKVADERQERE